MRCRKCGTKMDFVQRINDGSKETLRYVCPKGSCQETSLVVRGGTRTPGDPLADQVRAD
jgi:hypothetical protein